MEENRLAAEPDAGAVRAAGASGATATLEFPRVGEQSKRSSHSQIQSSATRSLPAEADLVNRFKPDGGLVLVGLNGDFSNALSLTPNFSGVFRTVANSITVLTVLGPPDVRSTFPENPSRADGYHNGGNR